MCARHPRTHIAVPDAFGCTKHPFQGGLRWRLTEWLNLSSHKSRRRVIRMHRLARHTVQVRCVLLRVILSCCSNFAFFLHSLVGHCVFHKSDPSTLTNTCLQPNPCGFNDVFRVEWMHCRGFSTVVVYEVLLCSCDDMCTCTCTCVYIC